ncbi:hypothetical protein CCM_04023 [Cordyceps militaris CM01]|uniref:Uncharacterized protein n=1 Tax=Cordyceps militaris (strain CM01) TaxID=983644 RepID=G3JDH5_CORMM|nr:uncharacterized protein CCM_04023 [Cordyceps militaris CM01]EGX92650.1 hypothetical protein CCM_04023 [Cordyceps militaris CM01]
MFRVDGPAATAPACNPTGSKGRRTSQSIWAICGACYEPPRIDNKVVGKGVASGHCRGRKGVHFAELFSALGGKAVLVVLLITCPLRPAKLRSLDLKVKIEIETAGRNLLQEPGFLRLSIKKRNAGFNGYTSCVGKPGGGRRSKRDKRRLAIGDFSAELLDRSLPRSKVSLIPPPKNTTSFLAGPSVPIAHISFPPSVLTSFVCRWPEEGGLFIFPFSWLLAIVPERDLGWRPANDDMERASGAQQNHCEMGGAAPWVRPSDLHTGTPWAAHVFY